MRGEGGSGSFAWGISEVGGIALRADDKDG
jgi:hypothetical protein